MNIKEFSLFFDVWIQIFPLWISTIFWANANSIGCFGLEVWTVFVDFLDFLDLVDLVDLV